MAKKTYQSGYIFTTGTSGNTAVTLPVKARPEQVLLIIHVPSKTTLYAFNDATYSNVVFSYIQKSISVTGTTTAGSTAITFTSPNYALLNYNTTGVQQGWRVTGTGTPTTGNTVDYTDGSTTIYLDNPCTASGSVTLTFTDQSYVTKLSSIPVNTSGYTASDRLLIISDSEPAPTVSFRDFLIDPVGKLRVSSPQSMIDTDFEYGPQATKWQTIAMINNMFASYGRNTDAALTANVATISGNGTSIVSVTTTSAHGLTAGQPIAVVGTSSTNANGDFLVGNPTSSTAFNYVAQGTVGAGSINQNGVIIYPGAFYTGAQIPTTGVRGFGNTTVQVTTDSDHGLLVNNTISVVGAGTAGVDGAWVIDTVPNVRSFTYTADRTISNAAYSPTGVYVRPQGIAYAKPWDGGMYMSTNDTQPNSSIVRQTRKYFRYQSGKGVQVSFAVAFNNPAQPSSNIAVRAGVYDSQNGAFFEWDGATVWACRRSSTRQATGTVTVTNGSGIVSGTGTAFSTEIAAGNYIVIKGVSYKVLRVVSDTDLRIAPAYRNDGTLASQNGVTVSITVDARIPQSGWNIDVADGTGDSGFKIDINKVLMWYIDYAWYGAGTVRYGVKNQFGEITYLHRFVHGNNKIEAYFRSGNLPVRYEVTNGATSPSAPPTLFHWGTSLIMDGMFSEDRGYTFAKAGTTQTVQTQSGYSVLNIRLAPTVDSGIPGNYGIRDLTNHMQLWPLGLDIQTSDSCNVQVVLNGTITTSGGANPTWTNVGGNSLTQFDTTGTRVVGGEVVFQALTAAPPPRQTYTNWFGQTTTVGTSYSVTVYDLKQIKELNNSIFGGFNTYPDGPDTLSVIVTPVNNNVTVYAQAVLRWLENQS